MIFFYTSRGVRAPIHWTIVKPDVDGADLTRSPLVGTLRTLGLAKTHCNFAWQVRGDGSAANKTPARADDFARFILLAQIKIGLLPPAELSEEQVTQLLEIMTGLWSTCQSVALTLSLRRQGRAHDFLVVPREHALLGVCRVTPYDLATEAETHGVQQFGPVDFVVLFRAQAGNNRVAVLAEDEESVAVLGNERRAFHCAAASVNHVAAVKTAAVGWLPIAMYKLAFF